MEILRRNLDEEQRRVAEASGANLLVLAGPGSGKTRLLTNVAAYQLRLSPGESWRVCCLTFTVEAARQLRTRLRSPDLGNVPSHRVWAGNFHQFSQMLLRSYGHLLGWPRTAGVIAPSDAETLVAELANEFGMRGVNIRSVLVAISAHKGRRPLPDDVDRRAESFIRLADAYQRRLRDAGLRDFDDLLLDALRLLREHAAVRRIVQDSFRHVLVDELQDTNQIQMDLLAILVDDSAVRIFGVADADQMIYAWRDARPENLKEFEERFRAEVVSLGGNYRCPPRIVRAASAVIGNNPNRELAARDLRSLVSHTEGELWEATARDEADELEVICDVIEYCRRSGTDLGSIAILAPHRFKFSELCATFDARGIAYVYIGSDEMERCPVVRVVRACLTGLANPERPLQVARVVDKANEAAGRSWLDGGAIGRAVAAASQAPPERLYTILADQLALGAFAGSDVPAGVAARLKRFGQMLAQAVAEEEPASSAQLASFVLLEWPRLEAAVLRSEHAVKVMTTYNAKGLEFDTVILPFCTKELVPWIPKAQRSKAQLWYEARRNFYVALTRSTHRVVFIRVDGSPRSVFLDEIPADLIQPWRR